MSSSCRSSGPIRSTAGPLAGVSNSPCRAAKSSRAKRAFGLGHVLLTRQVPTALPLAALERRIGPVLLDSVLITETVEAARLDQFLETWLANPPKGEPRLGAVQQRQLAQQVLWEMGRLLQRLHDNNFAHRDLKGTNMLVQHMPEPRRNVNFRERSALQPRRIRWPAISGATLSA